MAEGLDIATLEFFLILFMEDADDNAGFDIATLGFFRTLPYTNMEDTEDNVTLGFFRILPYTNMEDTEDNAGFDIAALGFFRILPYTNMEDAEVAKDLDRMAQRWAIAALGFFQILPYTNMEDTEDTPDKVALEFFRILPYTNMEDAEVAKDLDRMALRLAIAALGFFRFLPYANMEDAKDEAEPDATIPFPLYLFDDTETTKNCITIATVLPREPHASLPFYTQRLPADMEQQLEPLEVVPPPPMTSAVPFAEECKMAKEPDIISRLPVELLMEIMEYLSLKDIMSLGMASWRLRILEKSTGHLSWHKRKRLEAVFSLRFEYRYWNHRQCETCELFLREDCFLVLLSREEQKALRRRLSLDAFAPSSDSCVDCLQKAGELDGASYEDFLLRRCSACRRAKVLLTEHWCSQCHTCWACRKDWRMEYDGFCESCAEWRWEALQAYSKTEFPRLLFPLRNSAWYGEEEEEEEEVTWGWGAWALEVEQVAQVAQVAQVDWGEWELEVEW